MDPAGKCLIRAGPDHAAGSRGRLRYEQQARWSERQLWRPSTARAIAVALARTEDAFGPRPIATSERSDVEKWLRGVSDSGLAATTLRQSLTAVRMVFTAAIGDGVIAVSPATSVHPAKIDRRIITPLDVDEVRASQTA